MHIKTRNLTKKLTYLKSLPTVRDRNPNFSDQSDLLKILYHPAPVLRIRIRKIRIFLGLLDPDPLVRGTDADPSIMKQKW